jgi:DNA-binding NarL/FixJ family response regulator
LAELPLRVLVVDDDERFAGALTALLESDGRFEVAGWASNGAEAYGSVRRQRPDVVTMDIDMPTLDGVEAIRLIRAHDASVPIIVVSGSISSERVDEALAAGGALHVPKLRVVDDLLEAIAQAASRASTLTAQGR